jgi:hypothetical protein
MHTVYKLWLKLVNEKKLVLKVYFLFIIWTVLQGSTMEIWPLAVKDWFNISVDLLFGSWKCSVPSQVDMLDSSSYISTL